MTTLQKAVIGATLSVAVGVGVYEATQASNLRTEMQTLQRQQTALTNQNPQLQRERDEARGQLASLTGADQSGNGDHTELLRLRGEVARLRRDSQELAQLKAASRTNDAAEGEMRVWMDRVRQLKQNAEAHPEWQIPEFLLLTDQDWLDVARWAIMPNMRSDPRSRRALGSLRYRAQDVFGRIAHQALKDYVKANDGRFPTDLSQLKPYFKQTVDETILQRYKIVPYQTSDFKNQDWHWVGDWVITQKALVDEYYDCLLAIGLNMWAQMMPGGVKSRPQEED